MRTHTLHRGSGDDLAAGGATWRVVKVFHPPGTAESSRRCGRSFLAPLADALSTSKPGQVLDKWEGLQYNVVVMLIIIALKWEFNTLIIIF